MYSHSDVARTTAVSSQADASEETGRRAPKRGGTEEAAWVKWEPPATRDTGWGSMMEEGEIKDMGGGAKGENSRGKEFTNVYNTSFRYSSSSSYSVQSVDASRQSSNSNPYFQKTYPRDGFSTSSYSTSTPTSISNQRSSSGMARTGQRGLRVKETAVERRARRKRSENRGLVRSKHGTETTSKKSKPSTSSRTSRMKSDLVRLIEDEMKEDEREEVKTSEEMRDDVDDARSWDAEDWSTTFGSTDDGGEPMSRSSSKDWSWSRIDVHAEIPGLLTLPRQTSGSNLFGLGISMDAIELRNKTTSVLIGLGIDMGGGSTPTCQWTPVTTTKDPIDMREYSPPPHEEERSPLAILEEQRLRAKALQSLGSRKKGSRSLVPQIGLAGLPSRPQVQPPDTEWDWSHQLVEPQWDPPTPFTHQVSLQHHHLISVPPWSTPPLIIPSFLPHPSVPMMLPSAIPNRAGYFDCYVPPPPPRTITVVRASTTVHEMAKSQREVITERLGKEGSEIQDRQFEKIEPGESLSTISFL